MTSRTFDRRHFILAAAAAGPALAGLLKLRAQTVPTTPQPPAMPSEEHMCPVCGMFVAQHKDFLAAAVFTDGATVFFDGCKDMFRFLFDVGHYTGGRQRSDITAIWVTDYYSLKWTDGAKACFVLGSDVLGPMGRELIPFAKPSEAKEFLKDHKGRSLLGFAEVTPDILKGID
jgi:nitrous oxide reductase accessory protein NosL